MDVQDHTIPPVHATGRMQNYAERCKRMQTDANEPNASKLKQNKQVLQIEPIASQKGAAMNRNDTHAAEKYANTHIMNGRHIINHKTHEHHLIIGKMVFYWDKDLEKYRLDPTKTPEDLIEDLIGGKK